jgi:UDP-N-acetylmuramoyl-L-alanyl-D-glutamate--2,6-diaminopimelate ligase
VVAEISSHALAQKRADSTRFMTAVFTNLTRDHLDYHITMEDYYLSKLRLFAELLGADGTAVINVDDPYGRRLASEAKAKVLTYSAENEADIRAGEIGHSAEGLGFFANYMGRRLRVNSPLIGLHNVHNILAAFGALVAQGVPEEIAAKGIEAVRSVAGRFERVEGDYGFLVVVDYAHTPDALERAISTARSVAKGNVITVFGCGGDRDKGKRPLMGHVAANLSDYAIITSDNPRGEDPLEIIRDIARGVASGNYAVVPDRAEAIRRAVAMACPGDVVVIAGKGHEDYQEIAGRRTRFSDREEAEKALREKGCSL